MKRGPDEFSFQQLRAFREIVRSGSFSSAARTLGLSQPTISQHIANLEEVLGTSLVKRSSHKLALTDPGRAFFPFAEKMVDLREKAAAAVQAVSGSVSGTLRVGASTIPATYVLPGKLALFLGSYPRVRVHLSVGDTAEVVRRLREGAVDLGVTGGRPSEGRLRWEPFAEDRIVMAVPLEHPLASRRTLNLRDLGKHRLIQREEGSGTRRAFEDGLRRSGFDLSDLDVCCELGSTEAVKSAVAEGLAMSYLSERSLSGDPAVDRLRAMPLASVDLRRPMFLAAQARVLASSGPARAFFDFLMDHAN